MRDEIFPSLGEAQLVAEVEVLEVDNENHRAEVSASLARRTARRIGVRDKLRWYRGGYRPTTIKQHTRRQIDHLNTENGLLVTVLENAEIVDC